MNPHEGLRSAWSAIHSFVESTRLRNPASREEGFRACGDAAVPAFCGCLELRSNGAMREREEDATGPISVTHGRREEVTTRRCLVKATSTEVRKKNPSRYLPYSTNAQ
jgi:hypothetical protein